ncbi:MAG: DUF998 domain-containing protein [Candidatus Bathyarchaeota archaeon]|nr:DUF998 domain-containing protein [Candidatus Bathyarchaeota archaeon]
MNKRTYALCGILGPLISYVFIGISIASAPWFSWEKNALSDLGNALRKESAPYYNFGLALAGLLTAVYAVTAFRKHAKHTSLCLAASSFLLQLLAVFDEVYGHLHTALSILFFIAIILSALVYAIEKRSILSSTSFIIGLGAWTLYLAKVYSAGFAVPETISATATVSWILWSALRIYLRADEKSK